MINPSFNCIKTRPLSLIYVNNTGLENSFIDKREKERVCAAAAVIAAPINKTLWKELLPAMGLYWNDRQTARERERERKPWYVSIDPKESEL